MSLHDASSCISWAASVPFAVRTAPARRMARAGCAAASLLTIILAALPPAVAAPAKPAGDPRPLPPLSSSSIPEYPSLDAFLSDARATRLAPGPSLTSSRLVTESAGVSPRAPAYGVSANEIQWTGTGPSGAITRLQRAENGTLRWLEGDFGNVYNGGAGTPGNPSGLSSGVSSGGPVAYAVALPGGLPGRALSLLKPYSALMGLTDTERELRLRTQHTDELGWLHLRFDQVHKGVPVWGRDLYVHVDPLGSVRIVNGAYDRTPGVADTAPAQPGESAMAAARMDFRLAGRWAPVSDDVRAMLRYDDEGEELVLYPVAGGHRLAWAVSVRPNLLEWWTVVVDAKTGAILDRVQQHCDAAFGAASGTDLRGQMRNFRTWKNDQNTSYMLWDIGNYTATGSTLPNTMVGGISTLDLKNNDAKQGVTIYHITSPNNAWTDPAAVSAHYNANVAYDYFKNTFARNAIDGKDSNIVSIIHVTDDGQSMGNAFWNGRAMFYGDGDSYFKPLAGGLDVAAHEMSHGVIGNSAALKYQNQSGALNESFADVFGAMVDRDDYLMGEDVMKQGYAALRDLESPGNTNVLSPQPASMAQYDNTTQDNGGVHINSGIPNRASVLIMKAIGREKTEKIYYRALTTYLTSTSQFIDCRNAIEQSTKDLYPNGNAELNAVKNAFDTVGIKPPVQPPPPPPGGGSNESIPPVTGGTPYIAFATGDGSIGVLDPATGGDFVFTSTAAKARVTISDQVEDRAQLSTPLDGSGIWFANQQGRLAYIRTSDDAVIHYPNLYLNKAGDIWNVSIAPDSSYVALVSSSRTDKSLYVLDLSSGWLGRITLEPETTQDGIKDTSIVYPDVVSWSPNMGLPRIGFDALHTVTVNNTSMSYWGVAEINFVLSRMYDLVPGTTSTLTVGNITYSNTDPNVMAMNRWMLDYNAMETRLDVLAYRSGRLEALGLNSFTVNGAILEDPLRPTFSPDDARIAFTAPSLKLIGLYTIANRSMDGWIFNAPVYNPRWFVFGGSAPYTLADSAKALAIVCGLKAATAADLTRLNLVTAGDSATRIRMDDAVRITRKVTGIQP